MRILMWIPVAMLAACANTGADKAAVLITTVENGQAVEGARCSVINNMQRWDIITPASVDIGRAEGELHIRCDKDGYRSSELRISPVGAPASPSVGLGLGGARGGIGSAVGAGLGLTLPFGGVGASGYPPQATVTMTRE